MRTTNKNGLLLQLEQVAGFKKTIKKVLDTRHTADEMKYTKYRKALKIQYKKLEELQLFDCGSN